LKNIYEVLREKELQKARIEREVECLKIVAPLLSEENEPEAVPEETKPEANATAKRRTWPVSTLPESAPRLSRRWSPAAEPPALGWLLSPAPECN
jgi:hypothetical protein